MVGLLENQLEELKLRDEVGMSCVPPRGTTERKDPLLKRNGMAPVDEDAEFLRKAMTEATNLVSVVSLYSWCSTLLNEINFPNFRHFVFYLTHRLQI